MFIYRREKFIENVMDKKYFMNEECKSYNDLKIYIKNGIINMYRVIYIIIRKEKARAIELAKSYDTVRKVA